MGACCLGWPAWEFKFFQTTDETGLWNFAPIREIRVKAPVP
jgi:hypothetical protein